MMAVTVAFGLASITFPIFLATGTAIPFISPTTSQIMIPMQVLFFFVALGNLWVAIATGIVVLLAEGNDLSIFVAITAFGTGILISYLLVSPLTILLIETALYRQRKH